MVRERSDDLKGALVLPTIFIVIPILIGAMWLTITTKNTDYVKFMPWLLLGAALSLMLITLVCVATICYYDSYLAGCCEWIIILILLLLALISVYGFAIPNASARSVKDRAYKDYYLKDNSSWPSNRSLENVIYSTIKESNVCAKMGRVVHGVPESADVFFQRKLNPIQSGCCKPPTECDYVYVNETFWNPGGGWSAGSNLDCVRWSNDQEKLCYACDSCKAAVLAIVSKRWKTFSYIIVVTHFLWSTFAGLIQAARAVERGAHSKTYYGIQLMNRGGI